MLFKGSLLNIDTFIGLDENILGMMGMQNNNIFFKNDLLKGIQGGENEKCLKMINLKGIQGVEQKFRIMINFKIIFCYFWNIFK